MLAKWQQKIEKFPPTDRFNSSFVALCDRRQSQQLLLWGARGWERRAGEKEIAESRHASGVRQYCIIRGTQRH